MRSLTASLKSGWTWWWGFGLLIAAPALLLAWLGLRAVRTERLERAQQVREQQLQLARLADAALAGAWLEIEQSLRHSPAPTGLAVVFTFAAPDNVVFPHDKLWYGDTPPERTVNWSPTTQQLIEQAQAADAQGRQSAAANLYRRLSQAEPRLRRWAEFCLARKSAEQVAALLSASLAAQADDCTPTGLPVALLLCAYVEALPASQRSPWVPLLRQTLEPLRQGRWWLSADERQFYDAEVRRWGQNTEANQDLHEDARLPELAALVQVLRRSPPSRREGTTRSFERAGPQHFLLFYAPSLQAANVWQGCALTAAQLTTVTRTILQPLLVGQPFAAALRTVQGDILWSNLPDNATVSVGESLRSVSGWELVFSQPASQGWGAQRAWLWYGFILLLVVMLMAGLAMTARVVQRERELSRLQNEFMAAISHEFKSPLTSIRLLMERLTNGRVHEASEYHGAINRETVRLERLVNRLLESQQIQAGRKQYHFADADLNEIAATAVTQLQPQAEVKGIRLEMELDAALPRLSLDQAALLDALENLLDNAIKYSLTGTRVTLAAQAREDSVCIEVRDEGIGIAPDDLPRIFDRFYRGQPGNQHSVKGTGLGLALVKAAVEAHGGSIAVASQPGQGSRFTLQLPTKEVARNGAHSGRG